VQSGDASFRSLPPVHSEPAQIASCTYILRWPAVRPIDLELAGAGAASSAAWPIQLQVHAAGMLTPMSWANLLTRQWVRFRVIQFNWLLDTLEENEPEKSHGVL